MQGTTTTHAISAHAPRASVRFIEPGQW